MRRCRGEQRNGADREAVTALHALAGVTAVGAEAREDGQGVSASVGAGDTFHHKAPHQTGVVLAHY